MIFAARNDIQIAPYWLPGSLNHLADALSRFQGPEISYYCPQLSNTEIFGLTIGSQASGFHLPI